MTKAAEIASSLDASQRSVLLRMEADYAIAPGAWTVPEYEFIEVNGNQFKPVFISQDKGFGHTLTGFGKRVRDAAIAMETRRADTPKSESVAKP